MCLKVKEIFNKNANLKLKDEYSFFRALECTS